MGHVSVRLVTALKYSFNETIEVVDFQTVETPYKLALKLIVAFNTKSLPIDLILIQRDSLILFWVRPGLFNWVVDNPE